MKVAVVFPGQGSQNKSMLDSFEETIAFKNIIILPLLLLR